MLGQANSSNVNGQVRDTFGGDGDARADRDGWRTDAGVEYALLMRRRSRGAAAQAAGQVPT